MSRSVFSLTVFGLLLVLAALPLSPGDAAEAEKTGAGVALESVGLVGTIVAVVPESRTLVVDVPLEGDVLRIGAWVTEETRIEKAGAAVPFESLSPGARVRISVRRIATGNEAVSVEVLSGRRG